MELEYLGTLYDRWQRQSGGEYVAPPRPLQNYLKRDFSWGLGEAGWYPDFPTTAQLSRSFVTKGGAPPTDGTIAIDLKFIGALLELLGPVSVPAYDVTVTAANVNELTLALTRNENYVPGEPRKAFLSHLAHALLGRILAVPQERWVDLLRLLDRMGQERHLQLHFRDADLQAASRQYGLDGGLIEADGDDFLLVADTSVNSTKLNLIMRPRVILDVQLLADGGARSTVTYRLTNPLPEWQSGRDPVLVKQLMLEGVYGCYLRVYAPQAARFQEVRLDGRSVGAEQVDVELGKSVFGRFAAVRPGETVIFQFSYETPGVAVTSADGRTRYRLYLQKEAGTGATPLDARFYLPDGSRLLSAGIDGRPLEDTRVSTDLRTDRQIEIVYTTPPEG